MINHTQKLLPVAFTALLVSGISLEAATIMYDFDGGSASSSSNDFGAGVTADNVVLGGNGFESITMELNENRAQRKLRDPATTTLAITINISDSVVVDLTDLSFVDGIDSGTGSNTSYSQWDLAISTGSASPATGTRNIFGSGLTSSTNSLSLSGLTGLTDTSVTFTWTVNYGTTSDFSGGGNNNIRHAFLDDITFTGSVVPEPASIVLSSLGVLLLLRRRRH